MNINKKIFYTYLLSKGFKLKKDYFKLTRDEVKHDLGLSNTSQVKLLSELKEDGLIQVDPDTHFRHIRLLKTV